MNLLSSLLCIPDSHEPDSFDWGVAEFSNILYHGVLYEKAEVDFVEGQLRLYREVDPKLPLHQQLPSSRRKITAQIQHAVSHRIQQEETSNPNVIPEETYTPSELRAYDIPTIIHSED